jgi:hypothetical protein
MANIAPVHQTTGLPAAPQKLHIYAWPGVIATHCDCSGRSGSKA